MRSGLIVVCAIWIAGLSLWSFQVLARDWRTVVRERRPRPMPMRGPHVCTPCCPLPECQERFAREDGYRQLAKDLILSARPAPAPTPATPLRATVDIVLDRYRAAERLVTERKPKPKPGRPRPRAHTGKVGCDCMGCWTRATDRAERRVRAHSRLSYPCACSVCREDRTRLRMKRRWS